MATEVELAQQGAVSEFISGFHGDCGEDAELMALHAIRGTPLTAAALAEIVQRHQQHGWAGANGAEPLASIAHDLSLLGVRYTLYPYQEPWSESAWHPLLLANAGRKPIILQVANAQALPGDEAGVRYHFVCVEGINPSGYPTGDGDNAASQGAHPRLVTYDIGQLAAAQPCGMIVCETLAAAAPVPPPTVHPSTPAPKPAPAPAHAAPGEDLNAAGLGAGFAAWAKRDGLSCVSQGEHLIAPNASFAAFAPNAHYPKGAILYYNAATGQLTDELGPWVATSLYQQWQAALATVKQLKAQIASLQAAAAKADAAVDRR